MVVAGGGFKGGQVVGQSDPRGEEVAHRPVKADELLASIYSLLDINPEGPLPNSLGQDLKVMPVDDQSRLLTEIMKS
jgi:hypothetical protein